MSSRSPELPAAFLGARSAILREWQRESGLLLTRFDFVAASRWCLEHVEVQPSLADVPAAITECIGAAMVEVLA